MTGVRQFPDGIRTLHQRSHGPWPKEEAPLVGLGSHVPGKRSRVGEREGKVARV